jgi:DNA transformation protein and related proteins
MPRRGAPEFALAKPRPPGADFADHCCELLGSLGAVEAKRMFLGWGLSVEGLTVAVIAYDTLYLKAHADTLPQFAAAGCRVFEHESKGVTRRMQYYTAPEGALESRIAMQPWAALALQAALAARKPARATRLRPATATTRKAGGKTSTRRS